MSNLEALKGRQRPESPRQTKKGDGRGRSKVNEKKDGDKAWNVTKFIATRDV